MNKKRVLSVYFLFLYTVLFLLARFYIIAKSGSVATEALADQYVRRMDIARRYGFVFDRNGNFVDVKESGFITIVDPADMTYAQIEKTSEALSRHTGDRQSYFYEKLVSGIPFSVITDADISDENCKSFVKYEENENVLCHLLGYRNADGAGMSGVLQAYETFLNEYSKGELFVRYQADARGRQAFGTCMEIFDNRYSSLDGIYLTIDIDIQKAVEKICEQYLDMGAVVVQDTQTGEIYAMVSSPTYDKEKLSEYLNSDSGELLNRSILGYTPGSVFKTVVAAVALSESSFDPQSVYDCKGYIEIDGQKIRCHNLYGHGQVDLKEAFAQSCNPYFIDLGCKLGAEKIIGAATKMGIGRYDAINLIQCAKGQLPRSYDTKSVANMSVGQGKVLISPVQVCTMMSTAATGIYHKPSLVSKTVLHDDVTYYTSYGEDVVFDETTTDFLKEILAACVEEGTGYRARSEYTDSAGKTATAQSGQIKDGKEVIHSWFAGFFPVDSPRFTICVLCDGNGNKNSHPSEVFKMIVEEIVQMGKLCHE